MNSAIELFNGLDGKTVTRTRLKEIRALALKQEHKEVVDKINALLTSHPKGSWFSPGPKKFHIELTSKIKQVRPGGTDKKNEGLGCPNTHGNECGCESGLGAPRHEGIAKEALNECGRLKPGYVYQKGGQIKKVAEKPKKKTRSRTDKKKDAGHTSKKHDASEQNDTSATKPKSSDIKPTNSSSDRSKYDDVAMRLNASIEENTKKRDELFKKQTEEKDRAKNYAIFKERQELHELINADRAKLALISNLVMALKNGGEEKEITDKKGKTHHQVADFTKIDSREIEFNENNILGHDIPPYIPLLDQKQLESRGFVFDAIRIGEDSYLVATKAHDEKGANYVILTLDQLVLTSDYYLKMTKALYKKEAEAKNKRSAEHWNSISDDRKEKHYNQKNQRGLYESMPVKVKKTISFEKWTNLPWQEKEKTYKFYKRHGVKRIKSKLDSRHMWASMHRMYERFVNPKATMPKPRTANPEVFEYWKKFREMLDYKMLDIDIQRGDYAETRKKGLETSFGDSNTNDQLFKEHGILVKRQNGDKINPDEIGQIEDAWQSVEKVFGKLDKWARNFGLKISHTGSKLIYARKAIGVYAPFFHAIGVSAKYGEEEFNNTLAHELGHFLDHQIGLLSGKRYESDNYESIAGKIAWEFRENMNGLGKITSRYTLSTKECFARAMEQYFAMETYGKDVDIYYAEMEGPLKPMNYSEAANHVKSGVFYEKVVPLIKRFLKQVAANEPKNESGLGAPKVKVRELAEVTWGLSAAKHSGMAKMALNNCGRLRPGYVFLKGGGIEKVEKPPKKELRSTTAKKKDVKKNKISSKAKFEKALEALKFEIVSITNDWYKNPNNFKRTYLLNYDDVGGVKLVVKSQSGSDKKYENRTEFKYKGLGREFDEYIYLEENKASDIYEDILHAIGLDFKMSIVEASKLKEKYGDTLYRKKDKRQLGLFGNTKKRNKGLGRPIVVDGGNVTPNIPNPEILDIPVVEPQTISSEAPEETPMPATPQETEVSASTPKKKARSKKVLTSNDLMNMHFDTMQFDGEWADFMQEPAKNMRLGVMGAPKNGKSSGIAKFVNYLTKFGPVLYDFVDQGINKSTRDIWKNANLHLNNRAFPTDIDDLDELEKEIASGNYDFVVIDMINDYVDKTKISPQEFKDRFIKGYPSVSFILIFEVTKTGNFKGDQKWMHVVDSIVNVKDFVMYNRGRYGNGHHVIWKEGLKTADPKKYNELFSEEPEKNITVSGNPVVMV